MMLPALRRLPRGRLGRENLLTDDFKLADEGQLSVYWAPFEGLNAQARVVICGLTPGYAQMLEGFTAAREALNAGWGRRKTLAHIYKRAAFAGAMRNNLVNMLDEIGAAKALGIISTAALFEEADQLVHATSALRYPVFVEGKNYRGGSPKVQRSELLSTYVIQTLGPELAAVPDGLIIPLGKAAGECVHTLVESDQVDGTRCLFGFPHPSGANGHRVSQFRENHLRLRKELRRWAKSYQSGR
jgi:hypothetical protein